MGVLGFPCAARGAPGSLSPVQMLVPECHRAPFAVPCADVDAQEEPNRHL